MGEYTTELRAAGYEPTGEESPFDEDGRLWSNSYEFVCDQTAHVIRKDSTERRSTASENERYSYRNTDTVKMIGGFVSSYDWGSDENGFTYDR